MSKLSASVMAFCTWALVPISWMLNLNPRSFSACSCAPGGHSTPSEITRSVPPNWSDADGAPAAGPARAPRPATAAAPTPPRLSSSRRLSPESVAARIAFGSEWSPLVSSSVYPSCLAYSWMS